MKLLKQETDENVGFKSTYFVELVDTSAGVDQLLLAREERMAFGANLNTEFAVRIGSGRSGSKGLAACTADGYFFIIGMYALLHLFHLIY